MPEPRSVWDDLRGLANSIDHVISFEHEVRPRPPLVCEPMMEYDRNEDEIGRVCRIHQEQWWPCQAFREGRGVQKLGPETVQVLTMRPGEARSV